MISNKFLLRWRFSYTDKPDRYGVWNLSGDCPVTSASMQNLDGLCRAMIEGKDNQTRKINVFADFSARDFLKFNWIKMGSFSGPGVSQPIVVGMKAETKQGNVFVFTDGTMKKELRA